MSSNIIGPFSKKSQEPIERVKKPSGYFNDTEKPLVTTIDTIDKKGKAKQNLAEEANTSPISEKILQTQSEKEKNHKQKKHSLPPKE